MLCPQPTRNAVIYAQDTWEFFGVFGGHGSDQCSFIATRIPEELAQSGMPEEDAAVTALALSLGKEFLDSNQPSGSTGTFVIVKAPSTPGGSLAVFQKHDLMHLRPTQIQMKTQQTSFLSSFQPTEATLKFVVASVNEALGAPASQATITSVWAISATAVFFLAGRMVGSFPGQALTMA